MTLLEFGPLLSKAINRLPRIYNNKLKFPPCLGFLSSPPYFTHDASCIMLNIDWMPLVAYIATLSNFLNYFYFLESRILGKYF